MDEKTTLNTVLTSTKNMCEILFHGNMESSDKKVLSTFNNGLNEYLELQGELFSLMEEKGMYTIKCADENKILSVKEKYNKNSQD